MSNDMTWIVVRNLQSASLYPSSERENDPREIVSIITPNLKAFHDRLKSVDGSRIKGFMKAYHKPSDLLVTIIKESRSINCPKSVENQPGNELAC